MTPKVSVLIPTYNYARYLPEAIDSVLAQKFADFELIIVDDCSSDDTIEVVGRYRRTDGRIRFQANPTNVGMVRNWNLCLSLATGEYVKFLFGDDIMVSREALGKKVQVLDTDRTVSLVASSRRIIDAESRQLKTLCHFRDGTRTGGEEIINLCLATQRNLIGEPSVVMFRRSQASRGFDERYHQIVDLEMWFHLLEKGKFHYLADPLYSFRSHSLQQTVKNIGRIDSVNDTFLLLQEYLGKEYIRIGPYTRWYLYYDHLYHIWKSYWGKGFIGRRQSVAYIREKYVVWKFFLLFPVYKVIKPVVKLLRMIRGTVGKKFRLTAYSKHTQ